MSGVYKVVRLVDDHTLRSMEENATSIGTTTRLRTRLSDNYRRLMYFLLIRMKRRIHNDDALIITDLESEHWRADKSERPMKYLAR
jgi:hypothetical protein